MGRTLRLQTAGRRWRTLWHFDARRGAIHLCGVDEVGRGPLAGPVVAAAVVLRSDAPLGGVDDSKRLSPHTRVELAVKVREGAVRHAIAAVGARTIDRINIRQATFLAMRQAVAALDLVPDLVLVDGFPIPDLLLRQEPVVGGDRRSLAIAAASILAKVYRDALMDDYHRQYPEYGFDRHRGYGTAEHMAALRCHGPSPIHRLSFAPTRLTQQLIAL